MTEQDGPRAPGTPILHVVNGEHFAGAERVQVLLAEGLRRHGCELAFAVLREGPFAAAAAAAGAEVHPLPMSSRIDPRPLFALRRLIAKEGFAAVHAHTPRSLLVGGPAASLAGVPVVYHVHSPASRERRGSVMNVVNPRVESFLDRYVSRYVCVSEALAGELRRRGVAGERVTVVHNGIPPSPGGGPEGDGLFHVGLVGLLRPRKGVEILLEALRLLRRRDVAFRCTVAGPFEGADYERRIRKAAADLGVVDAVTFAGFTSDVPRMLRSFDALALPSLFGEGLPMVVLEAMAAALPVVASRVGGLPEIITPDVDGILCPPGDPEALAGGLEFLAGSGDARRRMGLRAREKQRRSFSAESMCAAVAAVYGELLRGEGT